ncbi:MAG TPA: hypothetical protein PLP07_01540 [Pyrinomonadaceae bacterium]|nr:hypothetical protein [Chloracidobacterium sp.]MBP9935826.1 hypothetical protein [Pyrinomonadaceae bacterium]MBK9438341.1 hypothetical protein [Chloracidobacterium sp.]MBK9767977.1 hypothetical protein [Chloracidobacterium sp.]MBL0240774.1 hypothetical protein [Chloracidobacterium sp.]
MKRLFILSAFAACINFFAQDASAQMKSRVRFARGTHSATVTATVKGFAYRDYIVGSGAGQTMTVSVKGTNSSTILTVFAPDGSNVDGAAETDQYSGELASSGDYVVRVGMMRSGARRPGATTTFKLKITVQ